MNTAAQESTGRLSWVTRIAYGSGDAACNVVYAMISTLLTIFYTDYIGISVVTVGLVMLLSRIFDGTSDVIMGFITERTHSRWGKARPWMLWMSIPYALTAISLFTVPQTTDTLQFLYIFVSYNLCTTVVYTAINVPLGTLLVRMTSSQQERSMLSICRFAIARFSGLIVVMASMPLVKAFGNNQMAWIEVITIFSIIAIGLLLFCFSQCKETVTVVKSRDTKLPILKSLKALAINQYFWAVLALFALGCVHTQVSGMLLPYYCKYILGNDDWMYSTLYCAEIATLIICALLCPYPLKYMSKRDLAFRGCILAVAAQLVFLLDSTSYTWAVITTIVRAIGEAPAYALLFGMIADAVEFGDWKTGIRTEALILGTSSMGYKLGQGIAGAIVSALLMSAGYISSTSGGVAQPDSALSMILSLYCWAPILIWGATGLVLYLYQLDKKYPKIMRDLAERDFQREQAARKENE